MLLETLCNSLINTVSTTVLSGYSEVAVAAVGSVSILLTMINLVFSAIASGASILICNSIGAGEEKRAQMLCFGSLFAGVAVSLLVGFISFGYTDFLLNMMNLEGQMFADAALYFRTRCVALFIPAMSSILLATLRSHGHMAATVTAGLVSNVVNTLLSILVIRFHLFSFIPTVQAIALCCIAGQIAAFLIACFTFRKKGLKIRRPSAYQFRRDMLSMLQVGVPMTFSSVGYTLSQLITNMFVIMLGDVMVSAKIYYANILSYTYLFSVCIGNANRLLIGRLYGAGQYDRANELNRFLVKITVVLNGLISVLLFIFRIQLLSLYTKQEVILQLAFWIFLIDIVPEQARAISQIYEYALQAVGDTLLDGIVMIASCWVFSVALSYILSIQCGLGIIGCWIGIALDECVRGIFSYLRWKSGKWKKGYQRMEETGS